MKNNIASNNEIKTIIRELDDGLALRRSTAQDVEALVEFHAAVHSDSGLDTPDERVGAWVRDLLTRPHPTFHPEDFTIVEHLPSGQIVSSMNLIPQTWTYEGIPFEVGRPELVGTLPKYRNHGLIRAQFEQVHKWSNERGQIMQAITGIPFFYRQFGYEMSLELGGGRFGFETNLPTLKDGESEAYDIRSAKETDIAFLMSVYSHGCQRSLVTCQRGDTIWRYELTGQSKNNVNRYEICIITNNENEPVGYLIHPWYNWSSGLVVMSFELKPGISWMAVTPSVARYLWRTGATYAERDNRPRSAFGLWLGKEHPAYNVFLERLPRIRDPYAWYIRLPDLKGFIRHITPVLEQRIRQSDIAGHTGELTIGFYRDGLKLVFEHGKLKAVEDWKPMEREFGNATFPGLTFLQMVFGYRTFEELMQSFADCRHENDEARVVLSTLFPKKASAFLPLE